MKYKIKVGNKYLIGESANETLKGTVRGDTTAVYSRFVGEMSAYDFCDNIEDADAKDAVTACDYVRGIMERQKCGFYLGEIKLITADAEEVVAHCKKEENATLIAMILDADADGKVWALDFYENHIEPQKEISYAEEIDNAPTVDAVQVVRCRDCEYYVETNGRIGTCELTISGAEDDGFCAWGERKDDEQIR